MKLGADARGRSIPPPHEEMKDSDKTTAAAEVQPPGELDPMYKVLPAAELKLQQWAQYLPAIADAENSQREWSGEYFVKWLATSQAGSLGKIPLIVLMRAEGGYDNDLDIPAAQMERERKEGQAKLVQLSTNGKQIIVHSGHNMELEAPDDVAAAIRQVVEAVRKGGKFWVVAQSN